MGILSPESTVMRTIVGFHQDEESHWVAELDCGHNQHTRHEPPLWTRLWVITKGGRRAHLGTELQCLLCDEEPELPRVPLPK